MARIDECLPERIEAPAHTITREVLTVLIAEVPREPIRPQPNLDQKRGGMRLALSIQLWSTIAHDHGLARSIVGGDEPALVV